MATLFIFLVLIGFLLLGIPIAVAMGLTAVIGFVVLGDAATLNIVGQRIYASTTAFPLLAIPFFILAGNLMNTGGMTERIFNVAHTLVGHLKGGLGHVNIVGSMIFAGMSGSALADAMGLGAVEVKAMTEKGYQRPFAAAVSAASATIGPVIPPSVPLVIFGSMTGVSVGALFLGGLIPGLLLGAAMMVTVAVIARRRNYPCEPRATLADATRHLANGLLALLTPGIIMGGILGGFFTPTEASVVACLYALFLGKAVYRELQWSDLPKILLDTANQTAQVMWIVAAAGLFGWLLIFLRVPDALIEGLTALSANKWVVLALINVILLILGCFMEGIAVILLTVPIFMPIILKMGIDPVHFGVVMTLNLMLGLLTPPVGMVLYAMSSIAKVSIFALTRELVPFFLAVLAVLILITFVPPLVVWLPGLVMGR
ncbi:MAG: TRAP transporter large permease [Betaproteobacteria bacterium]|nr:TRAP transporter large permease [Betaproteobacteria bacterium]